MRGRRRTAAQFLSASVRAGTSMLAPEHLGHRSLQQPHTRCVPAIAGQRTRMPVGFNDQDSTYTPLEISSTDRHHRGRVERSSHDRQRGAHPGLRHALEPNSVSIAITSRTQMLPTLFIIILVAGSSRLAVRRLGQLRQCRIGRLLFRLVGLEQLQGFGVAQDLCPRHQRPTCGDFVVFHPLAARNERGVQDGVEPPCSDRARPSSRIGEDGEKIAPVSVEPLTASFPSEA